MFTSRLIFTLFALFAISASCSKEIDPENVVSTPVPGTDKNGWLDPQDKQAVKTAYNQMVRKISVADMKWTGNFESCDPGTVSKEIIATQTDQLNFIRALAGIGQPMTLVDSLSAKMQRMALIMGSSNSTTGNFRWDTTKCSKSYKLEFLPNSFYRFCSFSVTNSNYTSSVGLCVGDYGSRAALLKPTNTQMGYGVVSNLKSSFTYSSLHVRGTDKVVKTRTPHIAWPTAGYLPTGLFSSDWSFNYANADFQKTTVSVQRNGQPFDTKVLIVYKKEDSPGAGIVWRLIYDTFLSLNDGDYFDVAIKNVVVDGKTQDFTYKVTILNTTP